MPPSPAVAVTWPAPIFEPLGQTLSDLAWFALIESQRSFFGHVFPVKRSCLGRVMFSAAELDGCPVPERVDWLISSDMLTGRGFFGVPAFRELEVVLKPRFMSVSALLANAAPGTARRRAPASAPPRILRVKEDSFPGLLTDGQQEGRKGLYAAPKSPG